ILRGKLEAVEATLKKEREERAESAARDFEARQNLEKANEDWKRKHADAAAQCVQLESVVKALEVKLKEKKAKVSR
ncbi:MAG TPA: hypothetical protein VFA98_09375, partial [Thermoanaerobaculia bacterium]|nr:hypothetical protein [Thermoanaerobaculia bacterium]